MQAQSLSFLMSEFICVLPSPSKNSIFLLASVFQNNPESVCSWVSKTLYFEEVPLKYIKADINVNEKGS